MSTDPLDPHFITAAPGELLRVDTRGRINVSQWADKGSNYLAHQQPDGTIVLRPAVVMTTASFTALTTRLSTGAAPAAEDTAAPPEPADP